MRIRNAECDLLRSILIIVMIISHTLDFFVGQSYFSEMFAVPTVFSGLLFCSGLAGHVTCFKNEGQNKKIMLYKIGRLLLAYYLSAFLYIGLIEKNISLNNIIKILFQIRLAGYSEFIVSWIYLYVILYFCGQSMDLLVSKLRYTFIFIVLTFCICTTVDYSVLTIPWLGPLIGCGSNCYFPIVQYAGYYCFGFYVNKRKIMYNGYLLIACLIGSISYISYYLSHDRVIPQRWGPGLLFVIGGYGYIYFLYLISLLLKKYVASSITEGISKNSLECLIISNLIIFLFKYNDLLNNVCSARIKVALLICIQFIAFGGFILCKNIVRAKLKT